MTPVLTPQLRLIAIALLALLVLYFAVPELALAVDNPVNSVADGVLELFDNATMTAIATLVILAGAVLFFSGHARLGGFITMIIGIFIMFAAPKIAKLIAGWAGTGA